MELVEPGENLASFCVKKESGESFVNDKLGKNEEGDWRDEEEKRLRKNEIDGRETTHFNLIRIKEVEHW